MVEGANRSVRDEAAGEHAPGGRDASTVNDAPAEAIPPGHIDSVLQGLSEAKARAFASPQRLKAVFQRLAREA